MERLSVLDAGFWALDGPHAALHIGGLAIFEGPAPTRAELTERYRSRLTLLPRAQERLVASPLRLRRAHWATDEHFDLRDHILHSRLPEPGSEAQLLTLAGRLLSYPLDRDHPLWEAWLIDGIEDGRWALLLKIHHTVIDGLGGMSALTALLDEPPPVQPRHDADSARTRRDPMGLIGATMRHPRRTAASAMNGVLGSAEFIRALRPGPANSLTGTLQAHRRFRTLTLDLADVDIVRNAFGGSVNDVVLGVVCQGFRSLLLARGEPPCPGAVRSLVPVAVSRRGGSGNGVSARLIDLPVDRPDTLAMYQAVRARADHGKQGHEAQAGELLLDLAGHAPAPAVDGVLRAVFRLPQHLVTTVITNVPGPRRPQSLLGRPLRALYPYVPLADHVRVGVAVTSYAGRLTFGFSGDRASVPDLDVLVSGVDAGLAELVKLALG